LLAQQQASTVHRRLPSPGANAASKAKCGLRRRWPNSLRQFPRRHQDATPFSDTTKFVSASSMSLLRLIEAGLLVRSESLIFLQDWRAMLGPGHTRAGGRSSAPFAARPRRFTVNSRPCCDRARDRHRGRRCPPSWSKAPPTISRRACFGHDAAISAMDALCAPIIGTRWGLTGSPPRRFCRTDGSYVLAIPLVIAATGAAFRRRQCRHAESDASARSCCACRCRRNSATFSIAVSPPSITPRRGYAALIGRLVAHSNLSVISA